MITCLESREKAVCVESASVSCNEPVHHSTKNRCQEDGFDIIRLRDLAVFNRRRSISNENATNPRPTAADRTYFG